MKIIDQDMDEDISGLRERILTDPRDLKSRYDLSIHYINMKKPDEALEIIEVTTKINKNYAPAYFVKGLAYTAKGDNEAAIREFTKAIEIDPRYIEPRMMLAVVYMSMDRINNAEKELLESIKLETKNVFARVILGDMYGKEECYDKAEEQYREAVKIEPEDPEIHFKLGTTLGLQGDLDEAIGEMKKAIMLDPDYADAHDALDVFLALNKDLKAAVKEVKKATSRKPKKPVKIDEKGKKLIEMTSEFCDRYLDEEYKALAVKLIEKMSRKRNVPYERGRPEIWAASVIYALGQINFLFDKSFKPYVSADELCEYFKANQSSVSQKAKVIRDMFKMGYFDEEFSTRSMLEESPFRKYVMIDNVILDKDSLPKGLKDRTIGKKD